jgi:NTE family protein
MSDRDIALALSGGGFRAAYFHLGVLQKLNEMKLLSRLGVISSVSGGSIVAAAYANSLLRNETFETFQEQIQDFLNRGTRDFLAIALGLLPFGRTSSLRLERQYAALLRQNDGKPTTLADLKDVQPMLEINSTAVHSGRGWCFLSGGYSEEWELGSALKKVLSPTIDRYFCNLSLAKAVAASAAFPAFSPVTIARDELKNVEPAGIDHRNFYQDLPDPVCLSDGGVTDNSALTSLIPDRAPLGFKDYYVIGSNAGAGIKLQLHPPRGRLRMLPYLWRNFDIVGNHNNETASDLALFVHQAQNAATQQPKGIATFHIQSVVPEAGEKAIDIAPLGQLPTRLKTFDWNTRERLMLHGANLLCMRMTQYASELLEEKDRMPGVEPVKLESTALRVQS